MHLQRPRLTADTVSVDGLDLPPARLGDLLRGARRRRGLTRRTLAAAVGLDRRTLRAIERGAVRPTALQVAAIAAECGTTAGALVPARVPVEVLADAVAAGGQRRPVASDGVLTSYVGLVSSLRGRAVRDLASLRRADLEALARALGDAPADIEARLARILRCTPDEARRVHRELLRRRILVPAAGVALGAAAVGAIAAASEGGHGAPNPAGIEARDAGTAAPEPSTPASTTTRGETSTTTVAPPTTAAPAATVAEAPIATAAPPPPSAPDVSVPPGETFTEVPPAPDVSVPPGETFTEVPPAPDVSVPPSETFTEITP